MSREQDREYQPRAKVIEVPERAPEGFDLRTHVKDGKTGQPIREQHYRLRIVGGTKYFERPVGSGNLWYESAEAAGRWAATDQMDKKGKPVFAVNPDAPHLAYSAPKSAAETNEELQDENAELRKELAARDAELERVTAPQKQGTPPKA